MHYPSCTSFLTLGIKLLVNSNNLNLEKQNNILRKLSKIREYNLKQENLDKKDLNDLLNNLY